MRTDSQGFVTLGTTLLVLLILTSVTLFAGRVLLKEKRISFNEQQYTMAFSYAESGLEAASRLLLSDFATICLKDPDLPTSESNPDNQAQVMIPGTSEEVTATWECNAQSPANIEEALPVTIRAEYEASDGGSAAVVSEIFGLTPLFNLGDPAPLTLASASKFNGTLDIGANPNGGGTGVPLSIWAGTTDDFTGAATTCGVEEFAIGGGACNTGNRVYSQKSKGSTKSDFVQGGQDIVIDDPSFPQDMFEFAFGISTENWEQIYQRGAIKIDDCASLTSSDTGIFVFEGSGLTSCSVGTIGTPTAPVILVAVDADLDLKTGPSYGVLFAFDSSPDNGVVDASVKLSGTALVYGAVMSNSDEVPNMNGSAAVAWHPEVFGAFDEDTLGTFRPLVRVAGSWKDF
ncbi:PilX N-terminal domain-containing pilus assembly protein [Ferrimonas balearica]|uniref:PilX N-terminal domain-containing pilus assembly protein n=1 Tax=Ferrimonas balearica TaxID=44012 RepID=UPI001C94AD58|nr:PilX N-terminal domain-containing pilus assembly protein [Ferrimonas balearica]MBY5981022.1 hypothetical protein [Ferrimonas balearica]